MADSVITVADITAYAQLSHDFNALHTDPVVALASPLGRLVPHGFLLLGSAFKCLHDNSEGGGVELHVAFRAPGPVDGTVGTEIDPVVDGACAFRVRDAGGTLLADGTLRIEP